MKFEEKTDFIILSRSLIFECITNVSIKETCRHRFCSLSTNYYIYSCTCTHAQNTHIYIYKKKLLGEKNCILNCDFYCKNKENWKLSKICLLNIRKLKLILFFLGKNHTRNTPPHVRTCSFFLSIEY